MPSSDIHVKLPASPPPQGSIAPHTTPDAATEHRIGAWTGEELNVLFQHVIHHGKTDWEHAVPGRTANQSRQQWKNSLEHQITQFIKDHKHDAHHKHGAQQ
ncbi:uncharacterized protein EHS24_009213 [Apiotrichum porosum]|uniref:Uncharacterized protein n=1 Tax=Apiotrichum porosum TaxID=105984 RepID=A0A427XNY7_9TREE|nr:uncharacterized protein EHS24_009213 [Apiotrichum porosum]RSH80629.1 hypothetical protein EHS24_009213 [Apiotrichum porosum]